MTPESRTTMVGLPAAALPDLHRALAAGRSAEDAAVLARQIGFAAGRAFHGALEQRVAAEGAESPSALDPESFWSELSEFFASAGWGELRYERIHPGVAILTGEGWAESEGREAAQPACHLTTGLLADLLSRVAGTDLAVMEVECRSGGHGACRFLVGSPAALQEVYTRMRDGSPYTEAVEALA